MKDSRFSKILFTRRQLESKIKDLAHWVNKTYQNSSNLVIVGLLKGSVPFLAQLIKDVKVDHIIDFMTITSYHGTLRSSGNVQVVMDLKQDIFKQDVLVIEDIVDSGITLQKTIEHLQSKNPHSIKILTLLDKPEGRKNSLKVDKCGFIVPNQFLAGFGLDVNEKLRNLPFIGIFDQTQLDKI